MLMRDDLGLLLLGAREAIYALDMNDITVKKTAVRTRDEKCASLPHTILFLVVVK